MNAERIPDEDIDRLKATVPLSSLIGASIALKKNGREYQALCPFHHEDSPSFTVNDKKGFAHCFGCGFHGDHIQWLRDTRNLSFRDAVDFLAGWAGGSVTPLMTPQRSSRQDEAPEWVPVVPVPDHVSDLLQDDGRTARIFNPKRAGTDKEWTTLKPSLAHIYRDAEGRALGYVLRCDFADGGKFTPQVTWCRNAAGDERWCIYPFAMPRPLYGLDLLAARPDAEVVVVEGEKAADAARPLLPEAVVMTWPGGSNGFGHADWRPLSGRLVTLVPDADPSGRAAMEGRIDVKAGKFHPGIAQVLDAVGARVRVVTVPEDLPDGWDLADALHEGWTPERTSEWVARHAREPHRPPEEMPWRDLPAVALVRPAADDMPDGDDEVVQFGDGEAALVPFRVLGTLGPKRFCFYSAGAGQVVDLTSNELTKNNLLTVAPLAHWERTYPGKRNGPDWLQIADRLITECREVGPFDPELIRGRGAWWDKGRAVVHLGDRLMIDGRTVRLGEAPGPYVYQRAVALRPPADTPLPNIEAKRFLDLCCMPSWERTLSGYLLAGWAVIAPICGALDWRPTIWLLGPSGVGKGWIINNILRPAVGSWALVAEGDTTAKGIEQYLRHDARPVIFDEAEAETEDEQRRMDAIMFLMRTAASSSGGKQMKGTTDGQGRSAASRTCFTFASINFTATKFADEARIAPLTLVKNADQGRFREIKQVAKAVMTEEFAQRLLARTIDLLPVIRRNAEVFAEAGAELFGSRRVGDQIGTLVAGAYSLINHKEITLEAAVAWLGKHDWSDHAAVAAEPDERRLLNAILGHTTRVQQETGPIVERNVGELVIIAAGGTFGGPIITTTADEHLQRHGLRVHQGKLCIANQHQALQRILNGTPWAANWSRVLKALPGACSLKDPIAFKGQGAKRVVAIPLSELGFGG